MLVRIVVFLFLLHCLVFLGPVLANGRTCSGVIALGLLVSAESLDEDVWPSKVVICLIELSETEATTPLHSTSSWLLGWGDQ